MIRPSDQIRFERVCRDILLADREREGIGTLNEKKLHTMLKFFVCDDKSCHEIKLDPLVPDESEDSSENKKAKKRRNFVADVLCDCDIFEIQTGHLYPLRDKIEFYLEQTEYNVTIIHPLAIKKHINYIDPGDGTVSRRVHSPKKEHPRDMLPELYSLLPYLGNRRLCARALLFEVEEFRLQSGRRGRRGEKYERIPTALVDIVDFSSPSDYLDYIPKNLPPRFTTAEFGKAAGYVGIDQYSAIKVLLKMGLVREDGTIGKAAAYRLT